MNASQLRTIRFTRDWVVVSVLLISLILRWILILRGGQYFNSDETRYEVARDAARLVWQGQFGEALRQFTLSPEHLGFKLIGIIPALVEPVVGPNLVLPAIFFSLFSVINLYLIYLLSRRQAFSDESLYALFLAASCLSLLYYSRHLFPYDMAMSFGLLALYIGFGNSQTVRSSLLCGSLSFLCFITYNGYWALAGFAMLANILMNGGQFNRVLRKTILVAASFLLPLLLLIAVMWWSGANMISAYRLFATTITQGSFSEGLSVPFEYFWHTEHAVFLILGAFSLLAILSPFQDSQPSTKLWAGGILFIYVCLVIPSMLQYFVVYARLARQLIPFLALLAAQGLVQMENRVPDRRKITKVVLAVIAIQAALNYADWYHLSYPREFAAEAQARFPEFEFSSKRLAFGAPVICQHNGYIIENAKFYVTPPESVPQVSGKLLLSALHPANFLPYQYEGDPPVVRKRYDSLKLRMNFYEVDEPFMSENNPDWVAIKDCVVREK